MGFSKKWEDKRLYGCTAVVAVCERKLGSLECSVDTLHIYDTPQSKEENNWEYKACLSI
jgi:hypothetical protein